jgi:replicative DNA helicase
MKTGIIGLDNKLNIDIGDVVVVGSRPGMGKSCLIRQIGINHAIDGGKTIIWSEDDSQSETSIHILCQIAGVERRKLGRFRTHEYKDLLKIVQQRQETGECLIDGVEYQRLVGAMNKQHKIDVLVQETDRKIDPHVFLDSLYDMEHENTMVIIDYVQLIAIEKSPAADIARFMTKVREIANRLNIAFVIGSQVSRNVENRLGHRPTLIELSDSSSLEEIPNKVMFILRRDYYDPNDKPGMAELIIAKDSTGNPCSVCADFHRELCCFTDRAIMKHYIDPEDGETFSEFSEFNPTD